MVPILSLSKTSKTSLSKTNLSIMSPTVDQQKQTLIQVVLIEDHELTRVSMRLALQSLGGIAILGEASDGATGVALVKKLQPDVVIVDLGLPELDGFEVTRQIKQQEQPSHSLGSEGRGRSPKVLILTLRDHQQEVLAAFGAGADSYCMKDIAPETLKAAIQTTYEGQNWIDPAIAGVVLHQTRQLNGSGSTPEAGPGQAEAISSISTLSERELEVLQLIVEGLSNAGIAERLYITVGTVKTHVRNLLNKLCADDRTQAAVMALRSGLIR
jgi:two-component system, NarL family, response regulator LiaR